MCNILRFLPGQMMDEEKFFNCVWNNWHSYGFVIKDGNGKMEIIRNVPDNGENDPKELWALLREHQDLERIVHVRHTTAGVTDLENCHPFDVLYLPGKKGRPERQLLFMHNGTMSDYKSKTIENGVSRDDNTGPSDSKNFVDQILTPMCQADYGTGVGDLSNPVLKKILNKFWPFNNRGILIANDQPSLFFGEWKEFGVGDIIKVANTDYFDKVIRGPEFERRKQKEAEEAAARVANDSPFRSSPKSSFGNLKDFGLDRRHDFYSLSESAVNILSDWEVFDREHAVSLGMLKHNELKQIHKDESTCLTLMSWVFSDYEELYKEFLVLEEKHKKASNMIANLVEERRTQEVRVG